MHSKIGIVFWNILGQKKIIMGIPESEIFVQIKRCFGASARVSFIIILSLCFLSREGNNLVQIMRETICTDSHRGKESTD